MLERVNGFSEWFAHDGTGMPVDEGVFVLFYSQQNCPYSPELRTNVMRADANRPEWYWSGPRRKDCACIGVCEKRILHYCYELNDEGLKAEAGA